MSNIIIEKIRYDNLKHQQSNINITLRKHLSDNITNILDFSK